MSTYVPISLSLEITLETALHVGTGFGLAQLLDDRTTCGPHPYPTYEATLPYIPGSSLKGRLRAHAERMAASLALAQATLLIEDLFGTARIPGRLVFPDAHLVEVDERMIARKDANLLPYLALEERTFVALSRQRRTAIDKRLARIEATSAGLRMETTLRGWLLPEQAQLALALLVLAAHTTTMIGGHKARGMGAVQIRASTCMIDEQVLSLAQLWEAL